MKKLSEQLQNLIKAIKKTDKSGLIGLIIFLALMLVFVSFLKGAKVDSGTITLKDFWQRVDKGEVEFVIINNNSVLIDVYLKPESEATSTETTTTTITEETTNKESKVVDTSLQDGVTAVSESSTKSSPLNLKHETIINPSYKEFVQELTDKRVEIKVKASSASGIFSSIFPSLTILILMILMLSYFTRLGSGGIGGSKNTTPVEGIKNKVLFSEVAGMTEEKEELMFAIESLKNIEKLTSMGVRPIKGILLEGPPGVGKTLLAKAVAGEAGVPFFSKSGADFVEMFVGVGASRVRAMYDEAVKNKPCVVFIDEIDALGGKRMTSSSGSNQESNQTLNALLERLDGVNSESGILLIGATNRVDSLDPALLRPGRFDKIIHIGAPRSKEDREAIVALHMRNKQFQHDLTLEKVAKLCYGFTGAEIEAVLNDAVLESFKDKCDGVIYLHHLDNAAMKMYAKGLAKGKHSPEEMKRVAIHEIGHALMDVYLGRKVVKVSIQPFSSGLGGVTQVDAETCGSQSIRSKDEMIGDLKALYGGMVAEKVILGNTSNGSSNDLERATLLIREIVGSYGMTDGMLLSLNSMSRENPLLTSNEAFISRMQKMAEEVYKETEDHLNKPENKERLMNLAIELMNKEVIYDLQ